MKKPLALIAAAAVLTLGGLSTGCKKLEARDNLNKGVQAFKNAKYPEAVEFFKQAIELDPTFPTARLYLATAYMSQYIPGAESPENVANAKNAAEHFQKVLETDPKNSTALKSLASLYYQQASGTQSVDDKLRRLDEAAEWYKKLAAADPNEKEAFYSLGVIAWAKYYPAWMAARTKLNMKPEAPGPIKDKKVRDELETKYSSIITEGISSLEKALQIDKDYDDAMAYLNLLHRERADLSTDEAGYKKDVDIADNWMSKALETRKVKAEAAAKKSAGGITEGN
jgi:tetratricopeptide (TPR) repeat protein